jgi:heterodisulfide reductase subunit A
MEDGKLTINYFHETLQLDRKMNRDLIILATPMVQHQDAGDLSKILKVPLGQDKFFLEAHVKLRPVDFATDGIFLCGTAHAPADINESISQAYGAASHATIPLANGYVISDAIVSFVTPEKCTGCGTCIEICPYGAIIKNEEGKAEVNAVVCKGCGTCASSCPEKAINIACFTDQQLENQIKAALKPLLEQEVA